jgi:hypothetical protein
MPNDRLQPTNLPHAVLGVAMDARLGDRPIARSWMQFLMATLVVWVALFCSGMGHAIGVPPDAVANRIESRVLTQLRHHGASQASRSTRLETNVGMSTWSSVNGPQVLAHDPFAAVLPQPDFFLEPSVQRAEELVLAGLPLRVAPRWQTPLTRAPPVKPLQA